MAFAAGQLFVSEARIAGTLEDTSTAYYAAESGIDKGISEFKQNRNAQACKTPPINCTTNSNPTDPVPVSLTNPVSATFTQKMWYLEPYVGDGTKAAPNNIFNEDDLNAGGGLILNNNGSRIFDVSKVVAANADIDLYFKYDQCFDGSGAPVNDCVPVNPVIEVKVVHGGPTAPAVKLIDGILLGSPMTREALSTQNGKCSETPSNSRIFKCGNPGSINLGILEEVVGTIYKPTATTLQIKVFGARLKYGIGLKPTATSALIDQGETTIESVGQFGRVKRKLQARIDRNSGTLIGIFDFTLFSQQGIQ